MVTESSSLRVHRVVSPVRTQVAENLRQAILGRHFKQTADACGLPLQTIEEIIQEIGDTAKAKIRLPR